MIVETEVNLWCVFLLGRLMAQLSVLVCLLCWWGRGFMEESWCSSRKEALLSCLIIITIIKVGITQLLRLRTRELRMTSEKCLVMVLALSTGFIIWMQNFLSPSENLGLNTTKKYSPLFYSKVICSAKAGILPEVRFILPSNCPVPSLKRNMLELFSLLKLQSRPTIERVQKDCPSKMESSVSWLLIWRRVRGIMALSLMGLQSFLPEYAICRLIILQPSRPPAFIPILSISISSSAFSLQLHIKENLPNMKLIVCGILVNAIFILLFLTIQKEIMHLTTSRGEHPHKNKVMQRSLIINEQPSSQHTIPAPKITIEPLALHNAGALKRSSLSFAENTPILTAQTLRINQNAHNTNPRENIQAETIANYYSTELRKDAHPEPSKSNGHILNIRHNIPCKNNQNDSQSGHKHGSYPVTQRSIPAENSVVPKDQLKMVNFIIEQIKEQHFGAWINPIKKEICQQINQVKNELKSMRAEWNLEKGMQANQYRDIKCEIGKMMDSKGVFSNPANSKIKKDNDLTIEKQMSMVQERIGNLQSKFGQNFTRLVAQFQKSNQSQKQKQKAGVKPGWLRCSMPPIVLQYKESFIVKSKQSPSGKAKEELVICSQCYHVDKSGFLLDGESRYLLDGQNKQIRLSEEQIELLERHHILMK